MCRSPIRCVTKEDGPLHNGIYTYSRSMNKADGARVGDPLCAGQRIETRDQLL